MAPPARTEKSGSSFKKKWCEWGPEDTSRGLLCFWTLVLIAASIAGMWFLENKIIPGTIENTMMVKTRCTVLNVSVWPTPQRCAVPECPYVDKFFEPDKCKANGRCIKLTVSFALANGSVRVHTRPLPTLSLRDEYVSAHEHSNHRPYKGFQTSAYVAADGANPPVKVEGNRILDLVGPPGPNHGCSALTCRRDYAEATAEAEALLDYWPTGHLMDCMYMPMPSSIDPIESGNDAPPVILQISVPPIDLLIYYLTCFFVFTPVAWLCIRRIDKHNRYGQLKRISAIPKRRSSLTTHDEIAPSFAKL